MIYNVTFPAGTTCASFDVPIIDDVILESNETFDMIIMETSLPYGVKLDDSNRAKVTILDNDSK